MNISKFFIIIIIIQRPTSTYIVHLIINDQLFNQFCRNYPYTDPPHFFTFPRPGPVFWTLYFVVFFIIINDLRWEIIIVPSFALLVFLTPISQILFSLYLVTFLLQSPSSSEVSLWNSVLTIQENIQNYNYIKKPISF